MQRGRPKAECNPAMAKDGAVAIAAELLLCNQHLPECEVGEPPQLCYTILGEILSLQAWPAHHL